MRWILFAYSLCAVSLAYATDDPALVETRYCHTEPLRDADGRIARRTDVLTAFQRIHPCPVNGMTTGACPGWSKDHIIPLANGGCDSVSNLQWLPVQIKSCMGRFCKDRWERKLYAR